MRRDRPWSRLRSSFVSSGLLYQINRFLAALFALFRKNARPDAQAQRKSSPSGVVFPSQGGLHFLFYRKIPADNRPVVHAYVSIFQMGGQVRRKAPLQLPVEAALRPGSAPPEMGADSGAKADFVLKL